MKRLLWAIPLALVLSALLAAAETSEGDGEREEVVEVESIEDSELPKKVEVTEAVKLRLVTKNGSAGTVGLPKGATVEVTGRDGNMLQIVFVKSAGQIDITKTTALDEVAKIRAATKAAGKEQALKAQIDAAQHKRPQETEEEKERDISAHSSEQEIPVSEYQRLLLACSWTYSVWSGKPRFSALVPHVTYTFKKDRTWRSIARYRAKADGSPVLQDMGKWQLVGDKLKLYHSGLPFDPDKNVHTLKFVSTTLLKFGDGRRWTAEVEQAD